MLSVVAALVICAAPSELMETVDLWEVNTFVCPKTGNEIFKQHIWWRVETHKEQTDFFVTAWRMNKQVMTIPNRERGFFVARFYDPKEKVFRTIRARQYLQTITQVDYEVHDKERLPEEQRSGLRKQ